MEFRYLLISLFVCSLWSQSSMGQSVFVKSYDQELSGASLEWDGHNLIFGGSHKAGAGRFNFQMAQVDTSGEANFSLTYDYARIDILRFIRTVPGKGYLMGGNSWGKIAPNVQDPDSSSIILGRLDQNGLPVRVRKLVSSTGEGGLLLGLAFDPKNGGYAFSALMKNSNGQLRILVGIVDDQDSLIRNYDFPYSNRSNLAPPTQNLAITDSGEVILAWNLINNSLGNRNEIHLIKIKDSLTVWQRRIVGDRMLAMAYSSGEDSVALYVVDSTNSNHGIIKLSLQNQGSLSWGGANTVNSGALSLAQTGQLHTRGGHIASLVNNHFTLWPRRGNSPEGFSLPARAIMHDFAMVGREVFLLGSSSTDGHRRPLLIKSVVEDTVSNCFTFYKLSPGFLPLNLNNNLALFSLRPPKTISLADTLISLSVDTLLLKDSLICVGVGSVWPGDANSDGVANHRDVLNVGLAYGFAGTPRTTEDSTWKAFNSTNWLNDFSNGSDFKQADCNGDGLVNRKDLRPVLLNYRQLHGKTGFDCDDPGPHPPFYLIPHTDSLEAGDTLRISIMLGIPSLPVDSLYGLSFSLCYDHTLVDSASLRFGAINSWLGNPVDADSPLISLHKDFYNEGVMEVGMSRTNQANAQGYGKIAHIEIFTIDDLAGKNDLITAPLSICLNDAFAITSGESQVCLDSWQDTVILYEKKANSTPISESLSQEVKVYPNPNEGIFHLELPGVSSHQVSIFDLTGRLVFQQVFFPGKQQVQLHALPPGIYQLRGNSEKGSWQKRVLIH